MISQLGESETGTFVIYDELNREVYQEVEYMITPTLEIEIVFPDWFTEEDEDIVREQIKEENRDWFNGVQQSWEDYDPAGTAP